jgi:hypothetical protein
VYSIKLYVIKFVSDKLYHTPVKAITTCLWLTAHFTILFLPGVFHSFTRLSDLIWRIPSGYIYLKTKFDDELLIQELHVLGSFQQRYFNSTRTWSSLKTDITESKFLDLFDAREGEIIFLFIHKTSMFSCTSWFY